MSTTEPYNKEDMSPPFNEAGEWDVYLASSAHPTVRKLLSDRGIKGNDLGEACIKVIDTQMNLYDFQKNIDNSIIHDTSLEGDESKSEGSKRSLFDHAALKIAANLGRNLAEDEELLREMESIPAIQRASVYWIRIPFVSKLLLGGGIEGKAAIQGGHQLDEWIQRNEKYMRARLCLDEIPSSEESEPTSKRSKLEGSDDSSATIASSSTSDWKRWMVGLSKGDLVFGSKAGEDGFRLTERPSLESFNGLKLLDAKRQNQIITRDLSSFKVAFDRMSGNVLNGLDWKNVLVAGGMVLAPLTSTTKEEEENAQAADLDVYLYGLDEDDAIKKLHHLESTFASNLPEGVTYAVLRNTRTITFIPSRFPIRRLQVVLKICKNPMEILLNFDLDPVGMVRNLRRQSAASPWSNFPHWPEFVDSFFYGFDGEEVWMLPRTARSLVTGYTTFTMDLIHGHYLNDRRSTQETRLFKYANRGYGIRFLPSYVNSILSISPNKPEPVKTLESLLEDQREKVNWFVAQGDNNFSQKTSFKHSDVDCREYRFAEIGDKNCLTSGTLFFRHIALWELARAGKIKLDESTSSFSEAVYHDDPSDYNDGPDLDWNENFTLEALKKVIEEVNLQELETLESHCQHLFQTEFPRDWENDGPPENDSFFPRTKVLRSVIEDDLSQALDKAFTVPVYLPTSLLEHSQKLLPEDSFSSVVKPELEEQRIFGYSEKPTNNWYSDGDDWKKEGDYKLMYWTRKGPIFQLINRELDEIFDILHAFRKGHAKLERDLAVREGLTRRFLTRRAVRPTQKAELLAFRYWVEVKMPHHSSDYQQDEDWGMFNVPSEIRERRFKLTQEEVAEIEEEHYFGSDSLSWWKLKLSD